MKNYLFIVEKTNTGFSAYSNDFEKFPVGTTGTSISELKANILEAANLYQEETGGKPLKESEISIRLDLAQFFEYYGAINAKGVAEHIGMSQSLLAQYIKDKTLKLAGTWKDLDDDMFISLTEKLHDNRANDRQIN